MYKQLCIAALIIAAFCPVLTQAAPPGLGLNDVTWLWPAPQTEDDLKKVISIDSLKTDDRIPVLTDEQFVDVLRAIDSDAAIVDSHRIEMPESLRAKSAWRIAAFRVDPTAPGGHEIIRSNFGEQPQIRLVLQPVTIADGKCEVHDFAIHLVYSFVLAPTADSHNPPDRVHFASIVHDLDDLKAHVVDAGVNTSGVPLGVHPGLAADVPGLNDRVREFLSNHLRTEKLTAMAIMGIKIPEPWIFLALGKFPPGSERFAPMPFLPAQMINFGSGNGVVTPRPKVNNINAVQNNVTMPINESDRRGVASATLFEIGSSDLDELAVIGKDQNGNAVFDTKLRNRDIPDLIANPTRSHFFNTDCVSCHTETRRRLRLQIPPGEFAYLRDGRPTQIADGVLPSDDWNVRNLGWFPPSPIIGGGPVVPTVTQRTANETAEVVEFIERHYRQDDSPTAPNPQHEIRTEPTICLEQGWSEDERQDFYYLGQGSQLIPYDWFLNLEVAESTELFRTDRHLASFGFIPGGGKSPLNPDSLPIGFAKDDNPSTATMKRALLGAEFDHQPQPTNTWLGFTCAACHTAEMAQNGRSFRIDGGAALVDIESFLGALAKSMQQTIEDDDKFGRFKERIRANAGGDIDTTGLRPAFASYSNAIAKLVERNKAQFAYGLGRLDAFGAILNQICEAGLGIPENHRPSNAPVSYPFLWDTPDLDWVQWNSSADVPITRNVGEVLGVFAHVDLTSPPEKEKFVSSVRIDYLQRLELMLTRLHAPVWPDEHFGQIDTAKADAGKLLFSAKCAGCHNTRNESGAFRMTEPNILGATFIKTTSVPFLRIGTDPQMVLNFVTRFSRPGDLKDDIRADLADPRKSPT